MKYYLVSNLSTGFDKPAKAIFSGNLFATELQYFFEVHKFYYSSIKPITKTIADSIASLHPVIVMQLTDSQIRSAQNAFACFAEVMLAHRPVSERANRVYKKALLDGVIVAQTLSDDVQQQNVYKGCLELMKYGMLTRGQFDSATGYQSYSPTVHLKFHRPVQSKE